MYLLVGSVFLLANNATSPALELEWMLSPTAYATLMIMGFVLFHNNHQNPAYPRRGLTVRKTGNSNTETVNCLELVICTGVEYHYIFPLMLNTTALVRSLQSPRDLSVVWEWSTFSWHLPSSSWALTCAHKIQSYWSSGNLPPSLTTWLLSPRPTW